MRSIPKTFNVVPWRLFEIPFPLQFPLPIEEEKLADGAVVRRRVQTRIPWQLNENFSLSTVQLSFLSQMNDAHDTTLDNLFCALYGYGPDVHSITENVISESDRQALERLNSRITDSSPYLSTIGYPISFDPIRETLLSGYPLPPKEVDIETMIGNFYALDLTHGYTSNEQDRTAILDFVRTYGLFIPFDPLSPMHGKQNFTPPMSVQKLRELEETLLAAYPPAYPPIPIEVSSDPFTVASFLWDKEASPTPYRDPNYLYMSAFKTKWFFYFEAFRVWHEGASTVQVKDDGTGLWPSAHVYSNHLEKQGSQSEQKFRQLLFRKLWISCHLSDPSFMKEGRLTESPDDWSALDANTSMREWDKYALTNENSPTHPSAFVVEYIAQIYQTQEDTPPPVIACSVPGCQTKLSPKRNMYRYHKVCERLGKDWSYCKKHFESSSGSIDGVTGRAHLIRILEVHPSDDGAQTILKEIQKDMRFKKRKQRKMENLKKNKIN